MVPRAGTDAHTHTQDVHPELPMNQMHQVQRWAVAAALGGPSMHDLSRNTDCTVAAAIGFMVEPLTLTLPSSPNPNPSSPNPSTVPWQPQLGSYSKHFLPLFLLSLGSTLAGHGLQMHVHTTCNNQTWPCVHPLYSAVEAAKHTTLPLPFVVCWCHHGIVQLALRQQSTLHYPYPL